MKNQKMKLNKTPEILLAPHAKKIWIYGLKKIEFAFSWVTFLELNFFFIPITKRRGNK